MQGGGLAQAFRGLLKDKLPEAYGSVSPCAREKPQHWRVEPRTPLGPAVGSWQTFRVMALLVKGFVRVQEGCAPSPNLQPRQT